MVTLLCNDCRTSIACIVCCREALCGLHVYTTRHAQHPSLWKIVDAAELARTKAVVQLARNRAIRSLERDLQVLEASRGISTSISTSVSGGTGSAEIKFPAEKRQKQQSVPQPSLKPAQKRSSSGDFLVLKSEDASETVAPVGDEGEEVDAGPKLASLSPMSKSKEPRLENIPPASGGVNMSAFRSRLSDHDMKSSASNFPGLEIGRRNVAAGLWRSLQRGVLCDESKGLLGGDGVYLPACSGTEASSHDLVRFLGSAMERGGVTITPHTLRVFAESLEGSLFRISTVATASLVSEDGSATITTLGGNGDGVGGGGGDGGGGGGKSGALPSAYAAQARSLMSALQDEGNWEIRRDFLSGELSPLALCSKKAGELAPPAQQRLAEDIRRKAILNSDLIYAATAVEHWISYPAVKCERCGHTGACSGMEAPGSGAQKDIRKAEVWGTAGGGDDSTRFLLRCDKCSLHWETNDRRSLL